MNTTSQASATLGLEQIPAQLLDLLSSGMSLGDIFNYTDEDYEVVYALGHSLYSQGRYLDAMKAFSFLVMHNQFDRRFYNALASSLQMLNRYTDAIQLYSMASVLDLSDPKPTYHTAECMIPLGMYAEARQALELVIEQSQDPQHTLLRERATAMLELISRHNLGDGQLPLVDPAKAMPTPSTVN